MSQPEEVEQLFRKTIESFGRVDVVVNNAGIMPLSPIAKGGVETSIVIPGAFTTGTNHFAHSGTPDDKVRMLEYQDGPYGGFEEQALKALTGTVPPDADVSAVAGAIVNIVNAPFGKRPFRVTVDPARMDQRL
nr:SDR family NAD(P)-dependent oxidoreductase [Edaphobacter bradus]